MEYKYIQIPVLTDEQHDQINQAETTDDAVKILSGFIDRKANTFYSRWFAKGMIWNIKTTLSGSGMAEDAGEHAGCNNYGNPLAMTPEPGVRVEKATTSGMSEDFFLDALALSRCDDAAVAYIRARKEGL